MRWSGSGLDASAAAPVLAPVLFHREKSLPLERNSPGVSAGAALVSRLMRYRVTREERKREEAKPSGFPR